MYTFFLPTLYWYCFSQPSDCADLNSAAVKPCSSPSRMHRYSFSVLCCHLPSLVRGRTVSMMWAWGLWPSVSWMHTSAHIPSVTKLLCMKSVSSAIHPSLPSSTGNATTNSRARRLSFVFSASSTAFQRTSRSTHSAGAMFGRKTCCQTSPCFRV